MGIRYITAAALSALVVALVACGGDDDDSGDPEGEATKAAAGGTIVVASDDFAENDGVPLEFTCEGDDVSPSLSWSGVPEDTSAQVVVVDDPEAGGFIHWLVFDIPPDVRDLPTGIPDGETVEAGGKHAENDSGEIGYSGPCPPEGEEHTYRFRVLAMHIDLGLDPGTPGSEVLPQAESRLLAEGQLTAKFAR